MTIVDVAKDRHIRNEGILPFLVVAFYRKGISGSDPGIVQYGNRAFPAGGCITVHLRKFRFFVRILVQFINLFFACIPGTKTGPPETDVASFLTNRDIVQLQIGVGLIVNLDLGCTAGLEFSFAVQVVRPYHNTAAADGNIRNLHVADGKPFGGIYPFGNPRFILNPAVCIPYRN